MSNGIRKSHNELYVLSIGVMLAGMILFQFGFFDWERLGKNLVNINRFLTEALPPDGSVLPKAGVALWETLQMAFAGTLIGFFISIFLGAAGAKNLNSLCIRATARMASGFLRAIPPLLYAVFFVIIMGLGPLAGTFSIGLYTAGILSKIYAELFESTDPEILEAVRGTGATMPLLVRYVVLPENANAILLQLLFMFEYNIRASSILGFVGAGGLGFQMYVYLQTMEYPKVSAFLILILSLVLLMDVVGRMVRRKYLLAK